jgi:hypothetical protein
MSGKRKVGNFHMESDGASGKKSKDIKLKKKIIDLVILICLCGLLIYSFGFIKETSFNITVKSIEKQSASFLVISTLKSSLGIIEGSDIGIGFRLQVGDIVQSTYDIVDFTWKILLYGILLITFCKILFEANILDIGIYLLASGCLVTAVGIFIQKYKRVIVTLGSSIMLAGFILAFYIPVATYVSFHSCGYFVDHIEKDLDKQLTEVSGEWEKFKQDLSLSEIKSSVRSTGKFIKDLFLKLTKILITFTCLLIIKYLLFPIIVAYGFLIVSKMFIKKRLEEKIALSPAIA